ncbi:MAG: T9SS type A sorting domain-containing protein [Ignavibacteria bacterium]|nr:T9SS type A sorting domain-containing protein [Ignavibacteria bacterium]
MKRIYFYLTFLLLVLLLSAVGTEVVLAQVPVKTGTFNVGFDKTPVWKSPVSYPGFMVNYYFPEMFRSRYGATAVAYTAEEMDGEALLTKMTIPIVTSSDGNTPEDFWRFVGYPATSPGNVSIFLRNAEKLPPALGPVDTSASNGWVKVWDGEYDYENNTFEKVLINNAYEKALVIEFSNAFLYTGGVLEVVFCNKLGRIMLDERPDGVYITPADLVYNYPFLCYSDNSDDFSTKSFPGPRYAFQEMIWQLLTYLNNYPNKVLGTDYQVGDLVNYTFAPSNVGGDENTAYLRPMVQFTYIDQMMEVQNIISSEPQKMRQDELNYNMSRINIKLKTNESLYPSTPLKLKKMALNTAATTADHVLKAKLYYTFQVNSFVLTAAQQPIAEYIFQGPVSANQPFEIEFDEPLELTEGDNYFWVVYEINTKNNCGDKLELKLNDLTLYGRKNIPQNHQFTDEGGSVTLTSATIDYTPVAISSTNKQLYELCKNNDNYTFNVEYSGVVDRDIWERSKDGQIWEVVNSQQPGSLTISKAASSDYTYYRYSVFGPEGCEASFDELIIRVAYIEPITGVDISYIGEYDLTDKVLEGSILKFVANIANAPIAQPDKYIWQINNGFGWQDIPVNQVPSANTDTLELIANTTNYFGAVRVLVFQGKDTNPDDCKVEFESNIIRFDVEASNFFFTEHPAKKTILCEGSDYEIYFGYHGTILEGHWQKNGEDIFDSKGKLYTNQILTIKGINKTDEGIYTYIATAKSIDEQGEEFIETFTTRGSELFVTDVSSVFKQPTEKTYAPLHGAATIEVIANHSGTTAPLYNDGYQWYKKTVSGEIKLENSVKYKGANSNVLVISYLSQDDYTYNGDYYFCEITGACNTVRTEPAYLLYEDGAVIIQKQPVDVRTCNGETITLSVTMQSTTAVDFQWYKDGNALVDDATISGSTTSELTITPSDYTVDQGEYWVSIKAQNSSNSVESNKVNVVLDYLVLNSFTPDPADDIRIKEGEDVVLSIEVESSTDFTEEIYIDDTLQSTNTYTADTKDIVHLLEDITADAAGTYLIKCYNECDTVEVTFVVIVVDDNGDPIQAVNTILEKSDLGLVISPNPVNGKFTVVFNSETEDNTRVELLDIKGTTLAVLFDGILKNGSNQIEYNLQNKNISTGSYFVRIVQGNKYQLTKLIFTK